MQVEEKQGSGSEIAMRQAVILWSTCVNEAQNIEKFEEGKKTREQWGDQAADVWQERVQTASIVYSVIELW